MTNAEKYLKDGVSAEKFVKAIKLYYYNSPFESELEAVESFLKAPVQSPLTQDERVILRNIDTDFYKGIGRENGTLYLVSTISNNFGGKNDREVFWYCFHELFQFIKERRRILY